MITSFMTASALFLPFFQALIFSLSMHPLHVSVTEIEFDEKDKALEIMMRVFIDDLELTLRDHFANPTLDILNPGEQTVDKMMASYLKDHFTIALDGKLQKTNYLGHERDGEAFVFYIEVSNVKKWKDIRVKNSIITEMYDDQSNLVHVTAHGRVRSLRLTRNKPAEKLTFETR